ncbi:TIGR00341 family protein [archaeon]|nr:TIGR00341 family protein [archaeon]
MKQLIVIIPKKKSKKLLKLLKKQSIKKYFVDKAEADDKYTITLTETQSKDLVKKIRSDLKIHAGKPSTQGYIVVSDAQVIAPYVYGKELLVELEHLILTDVKDFVRADRNFILFLITAGVIASLGFLMENLPLLLGAMIIGPIMPSIMAIAYGAAVLNKNIILKGLKTLLIGIILVLSSSIILNLLFANPDLSLEIQLATANSNVVVVLIISLLLGLIAAASFLTGKFEIQTGIAISITLIPPLANFITLLMNNEPFYALSALTSFAINVAGMQTAALIAFIYFKRKAKG